MTGMAIITGLAASILLLAAGYLIGLRQGAGERDRLRELAGRHDGVDPAKEGALRTAIQEVLAPLVERERVSLDLARVPSSERRHGLGPLLDAIASIGGFTAVVLSNDQGLPLAASPAEADQDRLLAAAARLFVVADQIAGMRGPLSVLIRDANDATTLCRMFRVRDQRLFLTAASNDPRLASSALDPALVRIESALVEE
jgi:hypothetical protein